jgi:integrase
LDERVGAGPEALVFRSPRGMPLRYSNFRARPWTDALKGAKLPSVGVHVLRYSAAAALIRSGASPKAVQTVLGHTSAAFTLTVYGRVFDADLDDVEASLVARTAGPLRDRDWTAASAAGLRSV